MKYIPIDEDALDDYVHIWLEFAIGLNPYIDDDRARSEMIDFLSTRRLDANNARRIGTLVGATASFLGTSKETH